MTYNKIYPTSCYMVMNRNDYMQDLRNTLRTFLLPNLMQLSLRSNHLYRKHIGLSLKRFRTRKGINMDSTFFNFFRVIIVKIRLAKLCIAGGFMCVLYLFINIMAVFELAHYSSHFNTNSSSATVAIINPLDIRKTVKDDVRYYFKFIITNLV